MSSLTQNNNEVGEGSTYFPVNIDRYDFMPNIIIGSKNFEYSVVLAIIIIYRNASILILEVSKIESPHLIYCDVGISGT